MNALPLNQDSACSLGSCKITFSGSLNKIAVEAGRDSATLFRALIVSKGFAFAAEQAQGIILSQSPSGYLSISCRTFEQNVEPRFKAKSFIATNGREVVAIIEDQRSHSLEKTLQMLSLSLLDGPDSLIM